MQSIKTAAANVLVFKIDPEWFVFITQPLDYLTLQHIDVSTWVKVSLDLKFKILVSSSSFSDFLNGQPEESLKRQAETLKIIPDCVVCKPVEVAPQPFFHLIFLTLHIFHRSPRFWSKGTFPSNQNYEIALWLLWSRHFLRTSRNKLVRLCAICLSSLYDVNYVTPVL